MSGLQIDLRYCNRISESFHACQALSWFMCLQYCRNSRVCNKTAGHGDIARIAMIRE